MSPKKKSAYTVPKLKDFSAKALDKAGKELLAALEAESQAFLDRLLALLIEKPMYPSLSWM